MSSVQAKGDLPGTSCSTKRDSPGSSHSTVVESPPYRGCGTPYDPYIVDWDEQDPENPLQWSKQRRWVITMQLTLATWNISFASASYSGGVQFTMKDLHSSWTAAVLGISLYVLGFGVGPLFFAPLSEFYGRRIVFLYSYTPFFFLHLGGAFATNIETLVICRFLGGIAGSAPLCNSPGSIADMWPPRERAMATAMYVMCAFLGPVLGPIIGGFVGQSSPNGWRIDFWILFSLSGLVLILAYFNMPETYAPVLLQDRVKQLQAKSGGVIHYASIYSLKKKGTSSEMIYNSLKRPFIFLLREPIVTCVSLYMSIVYGTLYAQFIAFPIVFQKHRHFSPGEGGLAFSGVLLGQAIGVASIYYLNRLYLNAMQKRDAPPEARLFGAMIGAVALPLGMFLFAWTSFPSIHPIVPILAGAPFGMGMILIFTSFNAYIIDAYSIYAASATASTVFLRSVFAAAFPLFSPPMFDRLGGQWACSVFAFLGLGCMPLPFLFFKYGPRLRSKSTYAVKPLTQNIDNDLPSQSGVPIAEKDKLTHDAGQVQRIV